MLRTPPLKLQPETQFPPQRSLLEEACSQGWPRLEVRAMAVRAPECGGQTYAEVLPCHWPHIRVQTPARINDSDLRVVKSYAEDLPGGAEYDHVLLVRAPRPA